MDRIARICEAVMRKSRVASHLDQPHTPQIGKVPRDRWLGQAQDVHDVADTKLAGGEYAQNSNARGISEAFEHGIEIANLRLSEGSQKPLRIIFV